jgi:hypothetical protein
LEVRVFPGAPVTALTLQSFYGKDQAPDPDPAIGEARHAAPLPWCVSRVTGKQETLWLFVL